MQEALPMAKSLSLTSVVPLSNLVTSRMLANPSKALLFINAAHTKDAARGHLDHSTSDDTYNVRRKTTVLSASTYSSTVAPHYRRDDILHIPTNWYDVTLLPDPGHHLLGFWTCDLIQ